MSTYGIRKLCPSDLRFAQEVRRIAGWNQTDADWRRLIDWDAEGCFLILCEGLPAGTATTTVFAGQLGWIGMVLVHPRFRRRGLAMALVSHCLDYLLNRLNVPCVKLDATGEAEQLYAKLGFQYECALTRWEGRMPIPAIASESTSLSPSGEVCEADSQCSDQRWWQELDRQAFGVDRAAFLHRLASDSRRTMQLVDRGFGMLRDGANASYLGPVVAADEPTGRRLVAQLLNHDPSSDTRDPAHCGGAVYWDIPRDNMAAEQLAEQLGFVRQRPLIRMWTGRENVSSDPLRQWAIAGPETG